MARTENKAVVNNFVGGLVSDFHELNTPPNTTVDEDNCDLDRKGSRKRRLGIDFETNHQVASTIFEAPEFASIYTKTFDWLSVNEDGGLNFKVVQTGGTLSFFDLNFEPLSDGEKPFTLNLDDFRTPAYYTVVPYGVQVASGKGVLFVVGEAIEPFYIVYDPVTDNITAHNIHIRIRDLELQDHNMGFTDQFLTLTPAQKYDLYNQGWWVKTGVDSQSTGYHANTQVMDWYFQDKHKYPQKAKSWWVGQITNVGRGILNFEPDQYDNTYVGNMLAPLGTYILDAFNQNRSGASGIAGLPVVTESSRPTAVTFASGRVFYGFKNKIFFSQVIIDDFSVAGNCYQQADPTNENINDLVATDGGTLQIIDSSTIFALTTFESSVFAFSAQGIWALGGSQVGSGFSATDFSLYKVTEAGALGPRSIVTVEATPTWWSKLGIYVLASDPGKQGYSVTNILEKKLQLFYNNIPALSKTYATGAYDRTKKVITWIYNSTSNVIGSNVYVCDKVLNYDLIYKAFYPYTLPVTLGMPLVTDVFSVLDIIVSSTDEDVVDNSEVVVVDETASPVTVTATTVGNASNTTSSLKFLTFFN